VNGHTALLARFCEELPALRAALRSPERQHALDLAVGAAQQGAPLADLLRRLGIPASEDDAVEGERNPTRDSWRAPTTSPLPGDAHLNDGFYRCPIASRPCGRRRERGPGTPLPTCHVHGRPMRFEPDWES
jgi:hypothetical protein